MSGIGPGDRRTRFVVLRHDMACADDLSRDSHFDWMFQFNDVLWTWATPQVKNMVNEFAISAERLADHRVHYLNYEGEISGGRGIVSRLLSGSFTILSHTADRLELVLRWNAPQGSQSAIVTIQRTVGMDSATAAWTLRFLPG